MKLCQMEIGAIMPELLYANIGLKSHVYTMKETVFQIMDFPTSLCSQHPIMLLF